MDMTKPTTVWVLARAEDPGLPALREAPADVRFVIGARAEAFREAPRPDAVLVCSMGRAALEPVLALAPELPWVHSRSAGVDHLMFPALVESRAQLSNGRGVFSAGVAEFAIAAVLFFAKRLGRMVRSQLAGRWDPFDLSRVAGRTLGILGYGDIGHAVAGRARALGMKVLALRRHASSSEALLDECLPPERKLELFARSDDVVVATPLTPTTRHIVGRPELAAMKPTAVLINVGRGPCVDEKALVRTLEAGKILGAALDVFETEPLPAGHPFYRLDNVLLSPHCGDHVEGWLDEAMRCFLRNLERFRRDEPLANVVDKRAGY